MRIIYCCVANKRGIFDVLWLWITFSGVGMHSMIGIRNNGDQCCDFVNIFAEKNRRKMTMLSLNTAIYAEKIIITLLFKSLSNFFAENKKKI
jgi:hypothetical protein